MSGKLFVMELTRSKTSSEPKLLGKFEVPGRRILIPWNTVGYIRNVEASKNFSHTALLK